MKKNQAPPTKAKRYLDLTLDAVFKHYFKSDKKLCADLIKQFIPPLKDKKVKILQYMDSDLSGQDPKDKHSILDILVQIEGEELINIEMQCFHHKNFKERVLFYWAKLFTRQLKSGAEYDKLRPVYSLIFTDYTLFKELKRCCSIFSLRCDEEPGVIFSEHLRFVVVELNKFKKLMDIDKLDKRELWMYLLKRSSSLTKEEIEDISSRSRVMKQAVDKLNYLSKEQRLQIVADFREKARLDELARIDYAKDEGIEQGRQELILNMLKKKLDIKLVSEITGLTESAIKKIQNTKKS